MTFRSLIIKLKVFFGREILTCVVTSQQKLDFNGLT